MLREMVLSSEGSSVKESLQDKQPSVLCVRGKCQDFTADHSGTQHWCDMVNLPCPPSVTGHPTLEP